MVSGTYVLVPSYPQHIANRYLLGPKVAVTRTQPGGRVLGVDIIPAQPPKGVSTIQGNFLSPGIQKYVREFLRDPKRGRPLSQKTSSVLDTRDIDTRDVMNQQYIHRINNLATKDGSEPADLGDPALERTVDVVLSDMSAPWVQTTGFWKRSLSDPYRRMMNTSGLSFKDHIGSMVCTQIRHKKAHCHTLQLSNKWERTSAALH